MRGVIGEVVVGGSGTRFVQFGFVRLVWSPGGGADSRRVGDEMTGGRG